MIFLAKMPWPALQKIAKEAETGKETTNISKRGKKYCLKKNAIFARGVIFILLPPSAMSDLSVMCGQVVDNQHKILVCFCATTAGLVL